MLNTSISMVNKVFILGIVLALMAFRVYGQFESIEVFAGPSRTTMRGESASSASLYSNPSYGVVSAVSIGVGTRFKLSEHTGLDAKLFIENRGIRENFSVPGAPNGYAETKIGYATIPILLSLRFGSKVSFVVDAGPHVSFRLSPTTNNGTRRSYAEDNTLQMGLSAGFGVVVPVGKHFGITPSLLDNFGLYNRGANGTAPYANVMNLLAGLRYNLRSRS
jgi:hypothetical protein